MRGVAVRILGWRQNIVRVFGDGHDRAGRMVMVLIEVAQDKLAGGYACALDAADLRLTGRRRRNRTGSRSWSGRYPLWVGPGSSTRPGRRRSPSRRSRSQSSRSLCDPEWRMTARWMGGEVGPPISQRSGALAPLSPRICERRGEVIPSRNSSGNDRSAARDSPSASRPAAVSEIQRTHRPGLGLSRVRAPGRSGRDLRQQLSQPRLGLQTVVYLQEQVGAVGQVAVAAGDEALHVRLVRRRQALVRHAATPSGTNSSAGAAQQPPPA